MKINTKLIENYMLNEGISLRELAKKCDLSPALLCHLLSGKRSDMLVSSLVKLAKGIDIFDGAGLDPLIIFDEE